eukprot:3765965-Pyramimonas_sp.AAC.1
MMHNSFRVCNKAAGATVGAGVVHPAELASITDETMSRLPIWLTAPPSSRLIMEAITGLR